MFSLPRAEIQRPISPASGQYLKILVTETNQVSGLYYVQMTEAEIYRATLLNDRALLTWTATGDNGTVGTAAAYQIRRSSSSILTETDFINATPVANPPGPRASGTGEAFTIMGLGPGTYHFVVRAVDEAGDNGPLSNDASITIP